MRLRNLPLLLVMTIVALWPQSLVICVAELGHTEFELSGAPCCPDEEGDCTDCVDLRSPDLRITTVAVLAVPIVPIALNAEVPGAEPRPLPAALIGDAGAERSSVVLLI